MHLPRDSALVLRTLLSMQSEEQPAQAYREVAARAGFEEREGYDLLCGLEDLGLAKPYDGLRPDGSSLLGWHVPDVARAWDALNRSSHTAQIQAGPRRRVSALAG